MDGVVCIPVYIITQTYIHDSVVCCYIKHAHEAEHLGASCKHPAEGLFFNNEVKTCEDC